MWPAGALEPEGWAQRLALTLFSWLTLGKLPSVTKAQFPYLENGDKDG